MEHKPNIKRVDIRHMIRAMCITLLFAAVHLSAIAASAQTITLTGPATPVVVQEGADFATIELHDPWDMAERRDIGWEENYRGDSISVAGGVWQGRSANGLDSVGDQLSSGFVMPLFAGLKNTANLEGVSGDRTHPHFGINNRIDTSKYTLLSFKMKHSDRSDLVVSWESRTDRNQYFPQPDSPLGVSFDGYTSFQQTYLNEGSVVYSYDMSDLTNAFPTNSQGEWVGMVHSLRIEPSLESGDDEVTEIDWVRLVDPDSAPTLTITWSLDTAFNPSDVITIYVDTDAADFDGVPIKRITDGTDPGTFTLPTAMLPPGDYFFYVAMHPPGIEEDASRSNYSAQLTITGTPQGYFLSPTQISGDDYAGSVVGNPWDMNGAQDVVNLNRTAYSDAERNFQNESFVASPDAEQAGTLFSAETLARTVDDGVGTAKVFFSTDPLRPIDPMQFRYISYRMRVDDSNRQTIMQKAEAGWSSEVQFGRAEPDRVEEGDGGDDDDSDDDGQPQIYNLVYEDWHTYTIDLWDNEGWMMFQRLGIIDLAPLTSNDSARFDLDWVTLTEHKRSENGQFLVSFALEDADSATLNVEVYFDTDDEGFDGTLIRQLNGLTVGNHSFPWDTSALPAGSRYYLYLVISDGTNTSRVYSPVEVEIGAFSSSNVAASLDYDGDGVSDQAVRRNDGNFFQNRSSAGLVAVRWVVGDTYQPIHGDFDGDGVTDLGLVFEYFGFLAWYIYTSQTNEVLVRVWGMETDELALADYNGDGRDEIAVWRDGQWFILDIDGTVTVAVWGLPGDVPVPYDYDGDGRADIAVWRPSEGTWWILNSGFISGMTDVFLSRLQWGLPGDMPVPADWNGDGFGDAAVFRPSTGTWFMRGIFDDYLRADQWGLPGDMPVVGDFNGDGVLDLTVYRDAIGVWFHNFRNRLTTAVQFGLPGDTVPVK